jgi:hypothetical protein
VQCHQFQLLEWSLPPILPEVSLAIGTSMGAFKHSHASTQLEVCL